MTGNNMPATKGSSSPRRVQGTPISGSTQKGASSKRGVSKKSPEQKKHSLNTLNNTINSKLALAPHGRTKQQQQQQKKVGPGKSGFTFVQINTHKSVQAHNDLLSYLVNSTGPVALVQEPHANSKNIISRLSRDMVTFSMVAASRRPRACIFAHKTLASKFWLMDSLTNEDCVVIQTTCNNTKCLIVSCYMDRNDSNCPPEYLVQVTEYARKHNLALIIGTDANAHNAHWNSPIINDKGRGDKLLDFVASENLVIENIGTTPTFDNGRWRNIIDLTITNSGGHELVSKWWVDDRCDTINCSDHNFINFKIAPSPEGESSSFRDINKTDWELYKVALKTSIESSDLSTRSISSTKELDEAGVEFTDMVFDAFQASCSLRYVSSKLRKPPWETKEVLEAKKEMRHRLRKARNTKSDKDWAELRSHQAQYKKLVKGVKNSSWQDFCKELNPKSSSKKISAIIKNNKTTKLSTIRDPDGKLTETPEDTLEVMTTVHFMDSTVIQDPTLNPNSIPDSHTPSPEEVKWDPERIFSKRRADKAISYFDPMSAAGPDGIRPIMLQRGWDIIGEALTNIARASYSLAAIPKCWKNSTGIFIPKPGKDDYYDPKSYRTITLSPVPLKFTERLIQWHMETDLKMESVLHKNQFGFRKGLSTEAALHKIVNKLETQILKGNFALGTFLDIEGAFDNVSLTAISNALNKYCPSTDTSNWIRSLTKSRSTTVELHGAKRTIISHRGCPQGGILSPLLWNLVMNNLFSYTRDKIPCDLQGFADDLILTASGFDADTLRDVTQKSLNAIEAWCTENGLKISTSKTHSVMFTRKQKWKLARPLKVHGKELKLEESTKFLGITLDQKLSWTTHITKQTKKAKGILMMCKSALGPTWGFTPATMKWIYTAVVRPMLSYGAAIWINGLNNQSNMKVLNSVQRLSHIMTTSGHPSTSLVALDKITNTLPIDLFLKEQAINCMARLKAQGAWENTGERSNNGRLQRHTTLLEAAIDAHPCKGDALDLVKSTLNLDTNFSIMIPDRSEYPAILNEIPETDIKCFTDGSKMEDNVGAGYVIYCNNTIIKEEAYHLGAHSTVFQAEMAAVLKASSHLINTNTTNQNIHIFCDSQATLMAIESAKIKHRTTQETVEVLNSLGESNNLRLLWIPAHSDYEGNERADTLAKKGSSNDDSITIKLPTPQAVWKTLTREMSLQQANERWEKSSTSHFKAKWKEHYRKDLGKLSRSGLRIATQILTGHASINYHLNKYKPHLISKTCPFCKEEDETINHFIGKCPKWFEQRGRFFNTFYASVSEIQDTATLTSIVNFAKATGRLDPNFEPPE
jgi:ribonuclease HI